MYIGVQWLYCRPENARNLVWIDALVMQGVHGDDDRTVNARRRSSSRTENARDRVGCLANFAEKVQWLYCRMEMQAVLGI